MAEPFSDHLALLDHFLQQRHAIADRIEQTLLNVRGKAIAVSRDRAQYERTLDACFFGLPSLPRPLAHLRGQLAARRVADGFVAAQLGRHTHDLEPVELVARAHQQWQADRWPGSSARMTFARCIVDVYLVKYLACLSLRIWDADYEGAPARLDQFQARLDTLNALASPGVFARDAGWLMQVAQGPLTTQVQPYFTVADNVEKSLTSAQRISIHSAGARLAGGHLRSQLYYRTWCSDRPIDDAPTMAITRNSNAMDGALLLWDLVPLLEAYRTACRAHAERLDLAESILQGLSADPELFCLRLDLLGPSTMIEAVFLARDDGGRVRYTPIGETHRALLERYARLLAEVVQELRHDAATFAPQPGTYSPFGIAYGFITDVMSNMALSSLAGQPSRGLGLEDMFAGRNRIEDKLAQASDWQRLPQRPGEREHFAHSPEWAVQIHQRLMVALDARVARPGVPNVSTYRDTRILVVPEGQPIVDEPGDTLVSGNEHCLTSDWHHADVVGMTACPLKDLLLSRGEGGFLASVEHDGRWVGVSKVILGLIVAQGRDVLLTAVPAPAVDVLRLTCPGLVIVAGLQGKEHRDL